jgi:hypothetical protein
VESKNEFSVVESPKKVQIPRSESFEGSFWVLVDLDTGCSSEMLLSFVCCLLKSYISWRHSMVYGHDLKGHKLHLR